jgi:chitinase
MPTVLRVGRFRFFLFSNEGQEPAHVHVKAGEDEAKFWLNPVQLAANYGFNGRELKQIQRIIEEHRSQLLEVWDEYFSA